MIRNKEIRNLVIFLSVACGMITFICFMVDNLAGIVSVISLIIPFSAFYVFIRRQYKNISSLSSKLDRLSGGEVSLDVRDNEEGELSILRNEIYKVTSMLTEQTNILEKEKSALVTILSDISHQMKTPLTSLLIMVDLLDKRDLPLEKQDEFIGNIRSSLLRMEWLVCSLLKMAKLDADAIEFKREIVSPEEIVNIATQSLDTILKFKKQIVTVSGDNDIMIYCDVNWTVEALTNIMKNASEYSPEKGKITITWNDNPLAVQIIVEDSGGGIDKNELPHLFQRFYRGKKASKESVGIGLALSLEIMRKQNGDIKVKNEHGKGAEFILMFYKVR